MAKRENKPERTTGGNNRASSLRNLKTFSSFKNPVYRLYYGGMLGQMASMNMQGIVGGLLLKSLTVSPELPNGSPALMGLMSLANAIPRWVFPVPGFPKIRIFSCMSIK